MEQYGRTIARFGSEFGLLLQAPLAEIAAWSPLLGEAISRMRSGRVVRQPGYDGEFGKIRVFAEGELERLAGRGSDIGTEKARRGRPKKSADVTPL
jgi:PHP family Zn ribbon phosphoesterase